MSDLVYEDLLEAGAPALPKGLFYRVRIHDSAFAGRSLQVEVRERGKWFSRSLTGVTEVYLEDRDYNEAGEVLLFNPGGPPQYVSMVQLVAIYLEHLYLKLDQKKFRSASKNAALDALKGLVGDHP